MAATFGNPIRWLALLGLAAVVVVQAGPSTAQNRVVIERAAHASAIGDRTVTFLARDLATGTDYVLAGSDLAERHTPWSSFKIPNLLIALETGIAANLEAARAWDAGRRPAADYWPDDWRRDQTLRTAFKRSAVWYFQDLALEVGADRYQSILADWGYGNAAAADGSDAFWLDGTLRISVDEQVAFLAQLLGGRLGVSASSIDALALASHAGSADGVSLHGKTGAGPVTPGRFDGAFEGWYSGFVRRDGAAPVVFSLHVTAPTFRSLRTFRRDFAVRLLRDVGMLPAAFPY